MFVPFFSRNDGLALVCFLPIVFISLAVAAGFFGITISRGTPVLGFVSTMTLSSSLASESGPFPSGHSQRRVSFVPWRGAASSARPCGLSLDLIYVPKRFAVIEKETGRQPDTFGTLEAPDSGTWPSASSSWNPSNSAKFPRV
jgi:hypothetical protein